MTSPTQPTLTALPPNFIWGASTSSYQIEGAVTADGRGPSIWDTHCKKPGAITNGDTGDVACDHYHRWREDVGLMRDMGLKAYRFSIAWPRLLPEGRGRVNEAGLAFYDRLIDGLLEAGIEPWICLYHWDLPQALDDLGGWTNRDSVGWYADYAALVARRYGDRVKRFATFNEPSVFSLFGYLFAWQAPAQTSLPAYLQVIHNVNLAHGAGVDVLRGLVPDAAIGAIHNRQPCYPLTGSEADAGAAAMLDACWNNAFPDPQLHGHYPAPILAAMEPYIRPGDLAAICRKVDWFGLNHYSPIYARSDPAAPLGFAWANAPETVPQTNIGWQVKPDAFRDTLLDIHRRYPMPIYVMENGCGAREEPDTDGRVKDPARIDFISQYLTSLNEAVANGADVRGYFVWSLLDNFEWGSGYWQRFGLIYVDYDTQRRIPKSSAWWYGDLIRSRQAAGLARR